MEHGVGIESERGLGPVDVRVNPASIEVRIEPYHMGRPKGGANTEA